MWRYFLIAFGLTLGVLAALVVASNCVGFLMAFKQSYRQAAERKRAAKIARRM